MAVAGRSATGSPHCLLTQADRLPRVRPHICMLPYGIALRVGHKLAAARQAIVPFAQSFQPRRTHFAPGRTARRRRLVRAMKQVHDIAPAYRPAAVAVLSLSRGP